MDFDASYTPLRDRVFSGNTNSAPSACTARPSTYKVWTHTNMSKAMKAVIEDGISIRAAAEMFSVPRSTLGDRISGKVLPGTNSDPAPYLTRKEEYEPQPMCNYWIWSISAGGLGHC